MSRPPFLVPAHTAEPSSYKIHLIEGTYLHGYNTAFVQIDALEAFIDDGAAYTTTDDELLELVSLEVDSSRYHYLWNDDVEAYEIVIPMEGVTYDNPSDNPGINYSLPCPHCGKAIRLAQG